jgi:teichuronic acid biosynthesis glycosyltransferase TuaG
MIQDPIVSIVMPAYNAEKYIQQSIDSVLHQTYANWELIIINDGSTDRTAEIVRQNMIRDSRIVLIDQINKKQAGARNSGLRASRGEWIAFLDADDIWLSDKLKIQIKGRDFADVIYTGGTILYEDQHREEAYPIEEGFFSSTEMYMKLYLKNPIPNLSVLMKRKWIDKIGLQNESLEVVGCEDWEYWIRLAKNGATFYGIPDKLFIYRIHSGGVSRNTLKMKMAEIYAKGLNIDATILPQVIMKKFNNLVIQIINRLLVADRKDDAFKFMSFLNEKQLNKYSTTRFMSNLLPAVSGKYILYLTQPYQFYKDVGRRLFGK